MPSMSEHRHVRVGRLAFGVVGIASVAVGDQHLLYAVILVAVILSGLDVYSSRAR